MKKGRILTVGELKLLPDDSVIHLDYKDDDDKLRFKGFVKIYQYDEEDGDIISKEGYSMPLAGHEDNELIEMFDNCGWVFTVCEAIKE